MLSTQHGHLDITRHIAPNQAWFEPEYFLALMEDGPTLFNLIGECFQDVGLFEWNNVIGKRCPNNTDLVKASFKEWPGTTWGSHQIVQCRQPNDLYLLALPWIHATLDKVIQLPWQRLPPLNNGAANSAEEEWTDLPHAPQGASVQVQRQTRLFCHFYCAKSEEKKCTHK